MVDGVDLPAAHQVMHLCLVAYRAENRQKLRTRGAQWQLPLQLRQDAVEIELAVFEQQQQLRLERENLAGQFRSDGATRTGDHDPLPGHAALEQLTLGRYRVTSEQVGDIHFLQVVHFDPTTGQVHEPRNTAHMHRQALEVAEDFPAP
ncbi:hypothetical protein WR25_25699 [Diploscapter pachys]|uniref:Uncharacterized protein n=1 Tax=Diploscapter pachys TaxID=2018661 RepID=A0A2A2K662_9BILA|nr:hypothetical protein WR25_25699 [Diploscapter pachys]